MGTYIQRNIKASATSQFWGIGKSSDKVTLGTAKNGLEFRFDTKATTGDNRAIYAALDFYGAAGGEVGRFFAKAATTGVAATATINGIHSSLSINTSSSIAGAGNAARFTLGAAAATRTLEGTLAVVQLDSDIGASNTLPATTAFIRVGDVTAVRINKLFNLPVAANSTLLATHTTQGMTHSIKCVDAAGTAYYIMATNDPTNRGGGS